MAFDPKPATRRTILIRAAALSSLPLLALATGAEAAGTLPKANANYQDKPKGGKACSMCAYYIPGAKPSAPGQCKVVAGAIVPTGWCTLFAAKPG